MHYCHRTLLLSHLRVDLLFIQSHPIGPASTDNGHKSALARYFAVRLHFLPQLIHRTRYDCVFVPTSQYPNHGVRDAYLYCESGRVLISLDRTRKLIQRLIMWTVCAYLLIRPSIDPY